MSTIMPQNVALVTRQVMKILRDWPALVDAYIERSAPLNVDPGKCPHVGIYRQAQAFPSRTLGRGSGYRSQAIVIVIAVTAQSAISGEECEEQLEKTLTAVMGALLSNESLNGTVDTLGEAVAVEYTTVPGGGFMQRALIRIEALTTVTNVI